MTDTSDLIDAACEEETATRERAIAASRAALLGEGAAECIDCGEDIPAPRRAAMPSARRCVGCQTRFEECL